MNKNVKIRIRTTQQDDALKSEISEFFTHAKFYKKDKAYYVVYDESEISGAKETTTTIKINLDEVSVIKHGKNSSTLNFKKNECILCSYCTEYGDLELEIFTESLDIDMNDFGGKISINYRIGKDLYYSLELTIQTSE